MTFRFPPIPSPLPRLCLFVALFCTSLCVSLSTVSAADDSVVAVDTAEPPVAEEAAEEDETEILPGHSYHGEFLNEGPRQAAYLMSGTGAVDFPVTTNVPETQAFIEQGLGQLYGFWYLEAERSFRQAAKLDPQCAAAYWGAALATKQSAERARGFIAEAVERKDAASRREQKYIEALDGYLNFGRKSDEKDKDEGDKDDEKPLNAEQKKKRAEQYTAALESIALEFPEDIEAKAFLALQLYENQGELPNPSYLAVDGLLDKVFAVQPMHPAHHFRIHLWDRKKAELALQSAALCGPAAPGIAHMWHMPGHIYSQLKRYEDAAWQQEASARVDHAHMIRDHLLPDQIHNFAHNNEWLIRNLNHIGRVRDAVDLAKNMIELPQHPKYNTLDKRGSAYYGRLRLLETLNRYELWEEAYQLCQQPYLAPTSEDKEQVNRLQLLGVACFMTARDQDGQAVLTELNERLEQKRAEQTAAGDKAAQEATEKAVDQELVKQAGEKARSEAAAVEPSGDDEAARLQQIEAQVAAAEQQSREEQTKQKLADIDKAREEARKPHEGTIKDLSKAIAQVEAFQAIAREDYDAALPLMEQAGRNVNPLQLALVRLRSGDPAKAIEAATKEVERNKNQVHPLAHLVELYFLSGDWPQAKATFERLREISSSIDLQAPLFQRLDTIASQLGYEGEWRADAILREDLGERPSLDTLGPFRWHPPAAASWKLTDADDKLRTLDDYEGQPVVVIFYLGSGCLHCAEQLQAFAPMSEAFSEAGLEIVAISSEGKEDLRKAVEIYDGKPLPFPLTSDVTLETFKAYGVYDDFEDQPLHATFLIDGKRRVRWQDIGFEPFMKPQFLLDEAVRLLGHTAEDEVHDDQ